MRTFFLIVIGIFLGACTVYSVTSLSNKKYLAEDYIPNILKQNTNNFGVSGNFLDAEIQKLKTSGEMFILANLTTLELGVYNEGQQVLVVPIQAKGREGSWWETPAGVYTIKVKSKDHFSSIGKVYMPWSMQFQGNFFIHGLPYYPDGSLVSTSYSGGCIRLDTNDAKKVYDLVSSGTKVIVYEDTKVAGPDEGYSFGPALTTNTFLAADLSDGFTFIAKNQNETIDSTAINKLLIAIVAAEYMNIERKVTVDSSDIVTTQKPRLQIGTSHSVYDYLYILLQESSEEASRIIRRAMGTSRSVDLVSAKARAIGMENTNFTTLDSANTTTLADTYQLLRYMNFNRKFLLNISADNAKTDIYGNPSFENIQNDNLFKEDPSFVGGMVEVSSNGKSGFFVFQVSFGVEQKPVGISVIDSKDLESDVLKLKSFIETSFNK